MMDNTAKCQLIFRHNIHYEPPSCSCRNALESRLLETYVCQCKLSCAKSLSVKDRMENKFSL